MITYRDPKHIIYHVFEFHIQEKKILSVSTREICYDAGMKLARYFNTGVKAINQLGFEQSILYALYQIGLRTGYLRWVTRKKPDPVTLSFQQVLLLPKKDELMEVLGKQGKKALLAEADEIVNGQVRLFGGKSVKLDLSVPGPLHHWTIYEVKGEKTQFQTMDVRLVWEAARFGWSYTLGRAYHITKNERYSQAFWSFTENFLDANPAYMGPNWISGQEAALRLIAYVFALSVFYDSIHTNKLRMNRIIQAISDHAARIPPTLVYARAQNNNHLLTEAAGLYTAGTVLHNHPSARKWQETGWKWFQHGLESQIECDGTYIQQSTNYHRLMLQIALWMINIGKIQNNELPEKIKKKLFASTTWLHNLLDSKSGQVPNLGPNDGAYILPLTLCPYNDYRPVVQTAAKVFLGEQIFDPGPWDEMTLWLKRKDPKENTNQSIISEAPMKEKGGSSDIESFKSPHILRIPECDSWLYFRAVKFSSRPGHADQLHVDLWWRGINLAQDAGTFLYNAPPPWDNSLTCSQVHNTVTVDGFEQMKRVSRFLYLDWAQAELLRDTTNTQIRLPNEQQLVAQHNGYRHLGIIHRRSVEAFKEGKWVIRDTILSTQSLSPNRSLQERQISTRNHNNQHPNKLHTKKHAVTVQWLIPDWSFQVEEESNNTPITLKVLSPYGWIALGFTLNCPNNIENGQLDLQIVRVGKSVFGSTVASPILGWSSPTYGEKIPALSIRLTTHGYLPISITSEWLLLE